MTDEFQIDEPLRVAVIVGSIREGRVGDAVADWFLTVAGSRDDVVVDLVDLAAQELPAVIPEEPTAGIAGFAARIGGADAFVVVTPEYNHGYPASLKLAIDYAFEEWFTKPVGFVSYGGRARGIRAVEQLRQVFGELHAVTIRDGVSIDLGGDGVDERGRPRASSRSDFESTAKYMLNELVWWARALRDARATRPYVA